MAFLKESLVCQSLLSLSRLLGLITGILPHCGRYSPTLWQERVKAEKMLNPTQVTDHKTVNSQDQIYNKPSEYQITVPALVKERVKYTTDLARLSTSNPILAFTVTVVIFSIAGIPPLAGFYSKAFLMFAAIGSGNYVLALLGVGMSVVSAFYYLRIVKILYFESLASPSQINPRDSGVTMLSFMQINKEISLVCALTFSFLLFFSLHPKPVFLLTQKAALLIT